MATIETGPTTSRNDRLVGDPGLWLVITLDICVFTWYFAVYITTGRLADPSLFERSRQLLNPLLGFMSTIVLLTSSWIVVLATQAAREGERQAVRRYLACAIAVASTFTILKIIGYGELIAAGCTIETNEFFRFYFAFTLIHFIHYLIGMGLLLVTRNKAGRKPIDARYVHWIESIASYWHKVDMLWIILFALLYLMKGAA